MTHYHRHIVRPARSGFMFDVLFALSIAFASACGNEPGNDGSAGPAGEPGPAGQDGVDGDQGAQGESGASCSVTDNDDGTKTIRCEDGTAVTLSDGQDGAQGDDGEPCQVVDNGDGSVTFTCAGVEATLYDGTDGQSGDSFPPVLRISPEPPGENCGLGGNRIEIGLDLDDDGELDDDEVTATEYACQSCDPLADEFGGGEGTLEDPYKICTVEHLSAIEGEYLSKHFWLVQDIDLEGVDFEPIGAFTGDFDGGGHRLSNLEITALDATNVGLFSKIDPGGSVHDLELFEPAVSGSSPVGALVGYLSGGTISDARVIGGSVTGDGFTGGIAGYSSVGTITRSFASADINGNIAGGVLGYNSAGTITNSYASGDVVASGDAGGLVGRSPGKITSSYATGNVSAASTAGGLVGYSSHDITDSYAIGNVSGTGSLGGLVGYHGEDPSAGGGVGTITGSYFNADSPDNGWGTALALADFAVQESFAGWDFVDTWRMSETRPVLVWEE